MGSDLPFDTRSNSHCRHFQRSRKVSVVSSGPFAGSAPAPDAGFGALAEPSAARGTRSARAPTGAAGAAALRALNKSVALGGLAAVLLLAGWPDDLAAADALQTIRARGELLWGADAEGGAPYVYPDPQRPEQLIGFEYELAEALATKLGVEARMVQNQWDQLIPALERGNFDIVLNGLELTPQNQSRIAMSQPYYAYAQQIVTRKETEGLDSLDRLKGRQVGALSGTAAQRALEENGGISVRIYPGNVESLRDLKAERIEAVVLDLPIALHYAKPDPALKFSGAPFAPGYYAIGVRKQDITLLAALNQAISDLASDHTLERIYRKYGLWDERQETLKTYKPVAVATQKPVSTLREWPKYMPLLLRGA